MNTAAVLVENLIQGMQTLCWMLLLFFSFFQYSEIIPGFAQLHLATVAVILVAICYWIGIIVDTAYYNLIIQRFEGRWIKKLVNPGEPSLSDMVFACITKNSDLAKLFLERQAHLRMLRVSTVNTLLLTFTGMLFLFNNKYPWPWFFTTAAIGMVFFIGTAYAWRKLYKYYVSMAKTAYKLVATK